MGKKSLTHEAMFLIIGRVVSFLFSFFVPLVLVRMMPESEYGLYQQALLIFSAISPFITFSMIKSLFYFFQREKERQRELIWGTFLFIICVGIVLTVLMSIGSVYVSRILNVSGIEGLIPVIALYTVFLAASQLFETVFILEERSGIASGIMIVSIIIRSIVVLSVAYFGADVFSLIYALMGFALFRFICTIILLLKKYRFTLSFTDMFVRQFKYSWPFGITLVVGNIRNYLDKFLISFFYSPAVFAGYSIASYQIPFLSIMFQSVNNVVLPRISKLAKERNYKEILRVWQNGVRRTSLFAYPSFIGLVILAREFIVTLFTEAYVSSVGVFIVFLFIIPKSTLMHGSLTRGFAKTKFIMKTGLFLFPIVVGLMFLLLKWYGVLGAAIANMIGLYLMCFIQLWKGKKLLHCSWREFFPWKDVGGIIMVSLLSGMILIVCKRYLGYTDMIMLLVGVGIYAVVYLVLVLVLGIAKKNDIELIKGFFYRIVSYVF